LSAKAFALGRYDPNGRLVYAGRAGTGINTVEIKRLWHRLQSLATDKMPLEVLPPRSSRFGSPLVLNRVHWVRPELIAEVKFLTWTEEICCIRSSPKVCARTSLREVRRPAPHRAAINNGAAALVIRGRTVTCWNWPGLR